jgi:hypothetical protein
VLEYLERRSLLTAGSIPFPAGPNRAMDREMRFPSPHTNTAETMNVARRLHKVKADAADARPKSLTELVSMARQQAGRGAGDARIVQVLMTLLNQHIGFNPNHNLKKTPAALKGVLKYWIARPSLENQLVGFDCFTLTSVARLALEEAHFPGKAAVHMYIPQLTDPDVAVVGSLDDPKILYSGNPVTDPITGGLVNYYLALFAGSNSPNFYEAALVYTDKKGNTYYFPGGVTFSQSDPTNVALNNPNEILHLFTSLGYCCEYDVQTRAYDLENGTVYSYSGGVTSVPLR